MEQHQFSIVETNKQDIESIEALLNQSNESVGMHWNPIPITVVMRDSNDKLVGGLSGTTNFGWLHISILAVDKALSGKGYGSKLVKLAEQEAIARGCSFAHLDTFSFQALPFYEKLGYEIFGTLDDYPLGQKRYYLRKTLSWSGGRDD